VTRPEPRTDARTSVPPTVAPSAPADDAAATQPETPTAERLVLEGICLERTTRAPIAGAVVLSDEPTATASDGTFRITFPADQQVLRIEVQHPDYVQQTVTTSREDVPIDPERFEVMLSTGIPVSLEVVDSVTQAPIVGARWKESGKRIPASTSDEQGRMRWTIQVGAEVEGEFTAKDYCDTSWSWIAADEGLRSGVVPLVPQAWLEGTVTDEVGHPLAGAFLGVVRQRPGFRSYTDLAGERWRDALPPGTLYAGFLHGEAKADEQATWRLPVVPSEHGYALSVIHPGYIPQYFEDLVLDSPNARRRIDVRLAPGGIVTGTVRRNGEPWSGNLRWKPMPGGHDRTGFVGDGTFRIEGVPPGTIQLRIEDKKKGETVAQATVEVTLGEPITQDLEWTEAFDMIAGSVVRTGGGPLGKVWVSAMAGSDGPSYSGFCRSDGTFEIEVPPSGQFEVSAWDRSVTSAVVSAASGARDVRLELAATSTLTISFVDASSGEAITTNRMGFLSWRAVGGRGFRPVLDQRPQQGHMSLSVPVGMIDLEIDLTEEGYIKKGVQVLVGERETPLEVALEPSVDARFELEGPAVEALSGHLLFLLREGGQERVIGTVAQGDGNACINGKHVRFVGGIGTDRLLSFEGSTARITGLEVGRYVLQAIPDDLRFDPAVVVFDEPGLAKVKVALVE
jgi:hypothetical protein